MWVGELAFGGGNAVDKWFSKTGSRLQTNTSVCSWLAPIGPAESWPQYTAIIPVGCIPAWLDPQNYAVSLNFLGCFRSPLWGLARIRLVFASSIINPPTIRNSPLATINHPQSSIITTILTKPSSQLTTIPSLQNHPYNILQPSSTMFNHS